MLLNYQSFFNYSFNKKKIPNLQLTIAVKSRSAVMKDILVEYITNPHQPIEERHVSSSDRARKRYRGMAPIFSIDDDQEGKLK